MRQVALVSAQRLVRRIYRSAVPVGRIWRPAGERRMRPRGVVKADPVADQPLGRDVLRQHVEIDRLVFE